MVWLQLTGAGGLVHLDCTLSARRVLGHHEVQLSAEQTATVFAAFSDNGFFELAPWYPPDGAPAYEGDIVIAFVRYAAQSHRVSARPPAYFPAPLEHMLQRLRDFEVGSTERELASWYWRAEIMTPDRTTRVRARGLLARRRLAEDELIRPASLSRAVVEPGTFVPVSTEEVADMLTLSAGTETFMLERAAQSWSIELWEGG
jgi:hypothetical protein